ncbi:MAG: NAD(P)/FAD-dependent oxidoreductase [Pseudomonadota bacterium]
MSATFDFDVIILGAGAAGLFCAAEAGRRGRRVIVLDHSDKPAEKVRISGGGRCNFTNAHTRPEAFLSGNPHFARSALARYTPDDFMTLMARHGLTWHEKTLGQLFCDQKSTAVIKMLLDEVEAAHAEIRLGHRVSDVAHGPSGFSVTANGTIFTSQSLVIATGGPSIPAIGASRFAYEAAQQFGHAVIRPRPGLVPFTFSGADKMAFAALSGVSCPVRAKSGDVSFDEAMLFTHRGLSGPAMLQISSYWRDGETIEVDLLPGEAAYERLLSLKTEHPKRTLANAIEGPLPARLAQSLSERGLPGAKTRLADLQNKTLQAAARHLSQWTLKPAGTEGWRTAEVATGGVDTDGLSSKTLESKIAPGLFFIGECVDVTGWLGGYNFQWAWASAWAASQAV